MSEMETEVAQPTVGGNTWDYLQEEKSKPADPKKPETEIESSEESSDEDENKDSKPWEPKKSETPGWARKRFKEYSTTVRELKEQNAQLMESMKQVLGQFKPTEKKLTKEDYPDEESFVEWNAEQKANEQLRKYDEDRTAREQQQDELRKMHEADTQNVQNALKDIPDYHEAIQNGDPEVRLPIDVVKHLAVSPAGPYVKYRIATDDSLSETLKGSSPVEKMKIISELHDSVLDILIARSKNENQQADVTDKPRTPSVQRKAPPPKAPPQVKGKGAKDLLSLSGDDYVKARNEMRKR